MRIHGRTADGKRILLFEHLKVAAENDLRCYVYLDRSITAVEVEVKSADRMLERTSFAVRYNPYRVAVFASRTPTLLPTSGYTPAASFSSLEPGDIYVVQESEPPETTSAVIHQLLARGIQVIIPQSFTPAAESPVHPEAGLWAGKLIRTDTSDPVAVQQVLDRHREQYRLFKARYYDLIAGANFYGIRAPEARSLTFRDTTLEDIAFTLEQQGLRGRLNSAEKALMILFYLPVIIGVALVKRPKLLLILTAGFLLIFALLSLLYPGRDTSVALYLNPLHSQRNTVRLEPVPGYPGQSGTLSDLLSTEPEQKRFQATDFSPQISSLRYSAVRSSGDKSPLQQFLSADAVKFDQIPLVRIHGGSYYLEHRNPLRAWSLHEPE